MRTRNAVTVLVACAAVVTVSACTSKQGAPADAITVTSTDDACELSATSVPSGVVEFSVTNAGSQATEFYFLGADGVTVVGEVENIGPGLTRNLVVQAGPGEYFASCKPGMAGDGITSTFTVTDSGTTPTSNAQDGVDIDAATAAYSAFVDSEVAALQRGTVQFAEAIKAGDDDAARALYAPTRVHWERIEPVAESFGDLDPILDAREADLAEGEEWTGWHRLEKDLWPPADGYAALTMDERVELANSLVADTGELVERATGLEFTVDQLSNGAITLLAEVASGKVTGEEEIWSHTDLWDFQANLDGAQLVVDALRPLLERKDAVLAATLDERFGDVQRILSGHRSGDGFVYYDELDEQQVKELATAVDALGEPLSRLTSTVLGGPN